MPDRRALSGDRNQCPECGEYFNSAKGFSKHRTGEYTRDASGRSMRRCRTPDEMRALGMSVSASGFWIIEAMRETERARRNEIATSE